MSMPFLEIGSMLRSRGLCFVFLASRLYSWTSVKQRISDVVPHGNFSVFLDNWGGFYVAYSILGCRHDLLFLFDKMSA